MGQNWSLLTQWFPPRSHFSVSDIPDLTGRVALVTGGNSGIGKETVRALLSHNATVYVAARDRSKATAAIADLKRDTGKDAIFLECDLADMHSVKRATEEFLGKETELHMLYNNGGVMWPSASLLTKDGYDLQWGTNVVGHFLLTKLLIPALLAGARSSPDAKARVVTTASMGAYFDVIDWDSFRPGPARDKLNTYTLYNQSKHGNVVFAKELARRYGDKGIVSTSVNPGNLKTELQRHLDPISRFLIQLVLYPVPYGALTQLWAGTSPETVDLNGKFFIPWARVGECRPETSDPENGRRLWEWLENETRDF
ncbi:hypothetical protein HETIRDRAFT_411342 [Heterobasidion irregulare TC 32-1]|uniref:NAD(P)-binding protein n=1 Tax=Heterobasidion irregulare (strain TC 32-1) TaxID=747525 RepID=W4JXQ5_HETIT|nr:uncharacterized protein HETIRDRAFT_411342 [Heterobasidion irregulare TC 32-1]ETW78254.1 hypothetical protein HETIRDRAFT_411342 [Heterobasidion irregulare TC 32-1]